MDPKQAWGRRRTFACAALCMTLFGCAHGAEPESAGSGPASGAGASGGEGVGGGVSTSVGTSGGGTPADGGAAPAGEPDGWAMAFGGPGYDEAWGVATDASDNAFVVGRFEGTASFGGPALSANGYDAFVASVDSSGAFRWSRAIGGSFDDTAYHVATDPTGNVYVVGEAAGQIDFGSGSVTCSADGIGSIFVASYTSGGEPRWGECFGHGRGRSVATDAAGDVYVTGWFLDVVSFGGPSLVAGAGGADGFVASLNNDGGFRWSLGFGSPVGSDAGARILADADTVYVTGSYQGDFDLGGTMLSSSNFSFDLFVAAFSASTGTPAWARGVGGPGDEEGLGMTIHPAGGLVVGGVFEGTMDLGGGTMTAAGGHDLFLAKFSEAGTYGWSSAYGAAGFDQALDLGAGGAEVFVAGRYQSAIAFDSTTLSTLGGYDAFVLSAAADGKPQWAKTLGGPGDDLATGAAAGANSGVVWVTGRFDGAWTSESLPLTPHGGTDAFLVRLQAARRPSVD